MPDAHGNFKPFAGTGRELPWLQTFEPGDRVRITATQQHGTVDSIGPSTGHYWVEADDEPNVWTPYAPGELRPLSHSAKTRRA